MTEQIFRVKSCCRATSCCAFGEPERLFYGYKQAKKFISEQKTSCKSVASCQFIIEAVEVDYEFHPTENKHILKSNVDQLYYVFDETDANVVGTSMYYEVAEMIFNHYADKLNHPVLNLKSNYEQFSAVVC